MMTLLLAHDFDEASERALDEAIALARKLDAKVVILHVYNVPIYAFPEGSALIPTPEEAARIGEAAQRHLDHAVARRRAEGASAGVPADRLGSASAGVPVEGLLRAGAAADEICKVAAEIEADMIVLGTHGRGVLGRAILGSVAQEVMRNAQRPVLTIRFDRGR